MFRASVLLSAVLSVKAAVLMPITAPYLVKASAMAFFGYEFADFGSGVYHWSIDNYGSEKTPVFGK